MYACKRIKIYCYAHVHISPAASSELCRYPVCQCPLSLAIIKVFFFSQYSLFYLMRIHEWKLLWNKSIIWSWTSERGEKMWKIHIDIALRDSNVQFFQFRKMAYPWTWSQSNICAFFSHSLVKIILIEFYELFFHFTLSERGSFLPLCRCRPFVIRFIDVHNYTAAVTSDKKKFKWINFLNVSLFCVFDVQF